MNKAALCAALGAVGGAVASALGGWNAALQILCALMGADYVTGLIVAGVFHASPKSESGALESRAGLKGLLRKGAILLVVFVAAQLDALLGTTFVRDGAVIAFAANESLSIVENAGLMGVPLPPVVAKSLEVLRRKADAADADGKTKEADNG